MTPAATAVSIIKNGDRVGWLAVHNELIERVPVYAHRRTPERHECDE